MVWHHNDYSEEALAEMQREAEERVREMQSRARLLATGNRQNSGQSAPNRPKAADPPRQNLYQNNANSGGGSFSPPRQNSAQSPFGEISKLIGGLGEDKLIILAVLWLLWSEHADNKLLLALLYILL